MNVKTFFDSMFPINEDTKQILILNGWRTKASLSNLHMNENHYNERRKINECGNSGLSGLISLR